MRNLNAKNLVVTLISTTLLLQGCGGLQEKLGIGKDDSKSGNGASASTEQTSATGDNVETNIRLLDASGLALKLDRTIGANRANNASDPSENLFNTYSSNFGTREGLSFGDISADKMSAANLMINYMLALNIVAYNAAMLCEGAGRKDLCACKDTATAKALLGRIVPYHSFENAEGEQMASDLANLCTEDYVRAMAASLSSVAFAKRN